MKRIVLISTFFILALCLCVSLCFGGVALQAQVIWQMPEPEPLLLPDVGVAEFDEPVYERELLNDVSSRVYRYTESGLHLSVTSDERFISEQLPVIVTIPGGSWKNYVLERHDELAIYFASQGYLVVTLELTNSLEAASFEQPIADARAAFQFLAQNAEALSADLEKLSIVGDSSGAHLASLIAYRQESLALEYEIDHFAGYYPPSDLTNFISDSVGTNLVQIPTAYINLDLEDTADLDQYLGCNSLSPSCKQTMVNASPIQFVDSSDPSTLIIHGSKDKIVPLQQSIRLADQLDEAGVAHELIVAPEMEHEINSEYFDEILEFIQ